MRTPVRPERHGHHSPTQREHPGVCDNFICCFGTQPSLSSTDNWFFCTDAELLVWRYMLSFLALCSSRPSDKGKQCPGPSDNLRSNSTLAYTHLGLQVGSLLLLSLLLDLKDKTPNLEGKFTCTSCIWFWLLPTSLWSYFFKSNCSPQLKTGME